MPGPLPLIIVSRLGRPRRVGAWAPPRLWHPARDVVGSHTLLGAPVWALVHALGSPSPGSSGRAEEPVAARRAIIGLEVLEEILGELIAGEEAVAVPIQLAEGRVGILSRNAQGLHEGSILIHPDPPAAIEIEDVKQPFVVSDSLLPGLRPGT